VGNRAINGQPVENVVLLGIPEQEFSILAPYLGHVGLENGAVLEREGARIDEFFFLNRGIALMIGNDRGKERGGGAYRTREHGWITGGCGDARLHSRPRYAHARGRISTRGGCPARCSTLPPELRRMLLRRLAIRSVELAQNAACNRIHAVKERIARLLLLMHNRLDTDLISTTHIVLSKMVGTDRPTVTLTLAALEQDGAIEGGHASIAITNRKKLEKQACACYSISKRFDSELELCCGYFGGHRDLAQFSQRIEYIPAHAA
jgi:hypothetical protein